MNVSSQHLCNIRLDQRSTHCLHLLHLRHKAAVKKSLNFCLLQALAKVALSTRVHHPNIVPVLGVAECPKTKDLLLVSISTMLCRALLTKHL